MNEKYIQLSFYFLIVLAFIAAFYNAYMQWFRNDFNLLLLILTVLFSLSAIVVKKYIRANNIN
ncbi:hypothetical protein [Methanococcoides burtonii]|uniref:hypothetical protein n=1 Tax=Methanococcoides burtonii TaxID=29291 RepID=UPI00064FE33D|nr:hypothetical protein [Methanococcoides burtonii]